MLRYGLILAIPAVAAIWLMQASSGPSRADWRLTAEPTNSTLQIGVEHGSCQPFDHLTVTETNDDVTIHAYIDNGDGCSGPPILLTHEETVELEAALGDRQLRGCRLVPDSQCGEYIAP